MRVASASAAAAGGRPGLLASLKDFNIGSRLIQPGTVNAYLVAPLFVAIATALCGEIGSTDPTARFALMFLALVATALIGGLGASLVAMAFAVLSGWYFFLPPGYALAWGNIPQLYEAMALIIAATGVVIGVGAMRTASARARQSTQPLGMIFESHPDGILLTDDRGRVTHANRRAAEIFERSRSALIGTMLENLFPERLRARVAVTRGAPQIDPGGIFVARKDGSEIPVNVLVRSIAVDGTTQAIATVRERGMRRSGDRRQPAQEAETRESNADDIKVWLDAFTHAGIGLTISDPTTGLLRFANQHWTQMHGWDAKEVSGMPMSGFFPEEERARLAQSGAEADRSGRVTFEMRRLRKDGSTFLTAYDVVTINDGIGNPLYRVTSCHDITDSKRAEDLVQHATKMEAIGGLTGGMAHDFNNLLGAIILSLDFVQAEMSDGDHLKPFVTEARRAAESGAELIRNLLAFARRQALHPTRIDVNDQVSGMHRLLSRMLGEEIAIVLKATPDVWPVIADRSQLEACILNLATNARDAMPKGGSLTITTSNRHLDEDYAKQNPSVTSGDYVMIAVSDTGTGMGPDTVTKIFEPFFTTKEVGQGSGLGLSMVFGFASQSGGHITVESEPGLGTTMRLFLPRAHLLAGAAPSPGAAASARLARGDGETILVVEDNVVMRRVVTRQLSELNYTVFEADNAVTALAMLENGVVDLLFSDVVMPGGMDGFELAERVRARWSSVNVLLTSGFSGDQMSRRSGAVRTSARLLGKPYDLAGLARAVREALDS